MPDGCSDFPANPYGKVKFYFNQKSKTGVFPVGTKATVTCVEGNPSPVEIICLLGSKWQSFDCPITAPVVPHDRIALPIGTAAESIFTIQSSIRISDLPVTTMNSTGIADKFSIKIGPENGEISFKFYFFDLVS